MATRKVNRKSRKASRKNNVTVGGKRKLSPALRAWNKKVMEVYRELKRKNPATKLRDAMKEAKKRK
jgi:hypothetical protein